MPSDDDDDAGGQTRPEPQLVRSPPALNRKQARTPLGKTNYFRLQQEEEEAKKRAQLEATKEITRVCSVGRWGRSLGFCWSIAWHSFQL
jgi:hypothetical protein